MNRREKVNTQKHKIELRVIQKQKNTIKYEGVADASVFLDSFDEVGTIRWYADYEVEIFQPI